MKRFDPIAVAILIVAALVACDSCPGQVKPTAIEVAPASLVTLESEVEGRWIPTAIFAPGTEGFDVKAWPDRKSAVVASGLPGTTRTVLLIPDDVAKDFQTFAVTSKGAKPEPGPQPQPGPNPGPQPQPQPTPSGPKWVVIVEEVADRTLHPEMAVLFASELNSRLTAAGHQVRWYDDDDSASGGDKYAALLKARGLDVPGVILFDRETRAFIGAFPIPADRAKESILESVGIAP